MGPSVARAVGPSEKKTRGIGGGDMGKWILREAPKGEGSSGK